MKNRIGQALDEIYEGFICKANGGCTEYNGSPCLICGKIDKIKWIETALAQHGEYFRYGYSLGRIIGVQTLWNPADNPPDDDRDVFVLTKSKNGATNVDKGRYSDGRWVHRGSADVVYWMDIPDIHEEASHG